MRQKAVLVLSFDCEGLWGLADILDDRVRRAFTTDALQRSYGEIVEVLAGFGLRATFAFVGAFTLTESELGECLPWFARLPPPGKKWVRPFEQDAAGEHFEGWLTPGALETVQKQGTHEIACHGFTHLPLSEDSISIDDLRYEMEGVKLWSRIKQLEPRTLVYPRNAVGFAATLPEFGFAGYRQSWSPQWPVGFLGPRVQGLLGEFNVRQRGQAHAVAATPVAIPSGWFLNWRSRWRRLVPFSVTVARWDSILRSAVAHGRVVHLWTHPHNLITGRNQMGLLEAILRKADPFIRSGQLVNMTQEEYCAWIQVRED